MEDATDDPRAQLATIRDLMERARRYRQPPAAAGLAAGALALAGAVATHALRGEPPAAPGLVWTGVFTLSLAVQLGASLLYARRTGVPAWSPLAAELLHALWPPFVAAAAFTFALASAGRADLVPSLWMLCYGTAGVAAGAFTSPVVRGLGTAFLVSGIAQLIHPVPPALAMGVTFGGFHLLYGLVVATRRTSNG